MNMLTFFRNKSREAECCVSTMDSGFLLLEVLVAVTILGSALAVLLGSVNRNLILTSQSKDLVIAETLAQGKLTEIELEGFPEVRQEQGEFTEAPGFKWFLFITPLSIPGLNVETRAVRLLITWDEGKKEFELTLAMSNFK
jgi:type II secretory pathway pseudopilin PulG